MDGDTLDRMRANRKGWREADLQELRVLYACLLTDIAAHRWAVGSVGDGTQDGAADRRLWAVLDRELG